MKLVGRIMLWFPAVCAMLAGGVLLAGAYLETPWSGCDVEQFRPGPVPGTAQHRAMLKAAEHRKLEIKYYKPWVESFREYWIVHFVYPLDQNFFGCSIGRYGGDGPTIWVTKRDFAVTKVELSQ